MTRVQKAAVKLVGDATLQFNFAHGEELIFDINWMSPEVLTQLALHGARQKIADSYAGADTVEDAYAAANDIVEMLKRGEWTRGRASTGGDLVEAMFAALGGEKSMEEVAEVVSAGSADERKEWAKHPAIKAEMARIKLERLAGKTAPVFAL